ncbi:hydrogenase maturation protease [Mariprofundus ferrooxydans]|uniref:HoxW protein n=1 Tax=Mariprofundus ferrooxydans PV-1 TaxID=314345 RepID=Q0EZU9_9PROT|nr:hydrogenase maturation protease [Mariprofundus ferrooxydans]EAU54935.1 HoxW protein [Mariprofundus ferrooxydans PV-1]KON46760.1 Ni/Fe hydrogenase [Mariprofundus ferrooxydans]
MNPVLVFGYGNPGRGDDGAGPALIERLETLALPEVACFTDMQLQVEHIVDMAGRELILFVDADASCDGQLHFSEISEEKDGSYTSHAMSPHALLHAYRQVYHSHPPPAFLLRIRGYQFELGESLGNRASANLDEAIAFTRMLCNTPEISRWRSFAIADDD